MIFWLIVMGLLSALTLFLATPIFMLIPLGVWLNYRLTRYDWILTNERLIVVSGWLRRTATAVSLEWANEANYTRGFFDRTFFGTGTVIVETAASGGATQLGAMKDTDPFRSALDEAIASHRARRGMV